MLKETRDTSHHIDSEGMGFALLFFWLFNWIYPFMKDKKMTQVASRFKYQQLYEMIRNDIEDGALKAGDKLPGQRELMADNKLS